MGYVGLQSFSLNRRNVAVTSIISACDKLLLLRSISCSSLRIFCFRSVFILKTVAAATKNSSLKNVLLHLRSLLVHCLGFFCFRSVLSRTVAVATKIHRWGNNASPSKLYRFTAWDFLLSVCPFRKRTVAAATKIHRQEQRFTFEAAIDSLRGIFCFRSSWWRIVAVTTKIHCWGRKSTPFPELPFLSLHGIDFVSSHSFFRRMLL